MFAVLLSPALASGCLDYCSSDTNCTQAGIFGTCESCTDYGSGGKCMSLETCNRNCTMDSDCWNGHAFTEACAYCVNNVCQPLQDCGGQCQSSDDCLGYYYTNYECRACVNGQCSAGCGIPCTSSNDCRGNYPCQICAAGNNTCQEFQSCGGPCKYDSQCGSSCPDCKMGVCTPPAACNETCAVNGDCYSGGACPDCVNSTCTYYEGCTQSITNGTCYELTDCNYNYCFCFQTTAANTTSAFCMHPNGTDALAVMNGLLKKYPNAGIETATSVAAFRPDEFGIFREVDIAEEMGTSGKHYSIDGTALVTEELVDGEYFRLVGARRHMVMPYHEAKILEMKAAEHQAEKEGNSNVENREIPTNY